MKLKALSIIAVVIVAASLLGACQNVTPQQAQAIVATYEALPAAQRTAVAEKAVTYLKSLTAEQKAEIKAKMEAAQAQALQARTVAPAAGARQRAGPSHCRACRSSARHSQFLRLGAEPGRTRARCGLLPEL